MALDLEPDEIHSHALKVVQRAERRLRRVGDPLPFGLHEVGDSVMAAA